MNGWGKQIAAMGVAVGIMLFMTVVGTALDSEHRDAQGLAEAMCRLSLLRLFSNSSTSAMLKGPITTLPKVDDSWLPLSPEKKKEQLYLRWKMELNRPVPSSEP